MFKTIRMIFGEKNKDSFNSTEIETIPSNEHPRVRELKELAASFGHNIKACPYCEISLEKTPKRKTKCKSCGEFIYPRTNQLTGRKILLVEKELELHTEMEAYKKGYWKSWYKERQELIESKKIVAKILGQGDWTKISDNDARWNRLSNERLEHLKNGDWYHYRLSTSSMFPILQTEGKLDREFNLKSEFIFLRYNFPRHLNLCDAKFSSDRDKHISLSDLSMLWSNNIDIKEFYEEFHSNLESNGWDGNPQFKYSAHECWNMFCDDIDLHKDFFNSLSS